VSKPSEATAQPVPFTSNGAQQVSEGGFTGVSINFTNSDNQNGYVVNVFFAWYNAVSQIVRIDEESGVVFAPGQTIGFVDAWNVPGAYTVHAFLEDLSGNALSTAYEAQVTVAQPVEPFVCTGTQVPLDSGFPGLQTTFTSNEQNNVTVDVYFVWYNQLGQVASIDANLGVFFTPGQSLSVFSDFSMPGRYYVMAFVRDPRGGRTFRALFGTSLSHVDPDAPTKIARPFPRKR